MQDNNIAISELKKLIEKCKGKSVETQFDKPSVVRQPNAQRIPKPSVLGKPTPFSNSPEMRSFQTKQSVNKTNVSDGSSKQVTQHNLPQNRKQAEIHTNTLTLGMYRITTSTTQNREPQLPHASRNTNPHVVPNNSQVKFTKKEVEDHHRISSISKKTKSVTAYNDSSNSRTLNVNVVCAECLVLHQMASAGNNTSGPVPQCSNDVCSHQFRPRLVLHQMTSDHNRSELGILVHSNEPSSSKLVPKVVPLAVKTATSRQELELLFHHHIAMLRTTCKYY
ncbi:hypothetical protein Tco_0379406 [Tanacetum coccineum]